MVGFFEFIRNLGGKVTGEISYRCTSSHAEKLRQCRLAIKTKPRSMLLLTGTTGYYEYKSTKYFYIS